MIISPDGMKFCFVREHDWSGEYKDGIFYLNCDKCDAQNVDYRPTKWEQSALEKGWIGPNDLGIRLSPWGESVHKNQGDWISPSRREYLKSRAGAK